MDPDPFDERHPSRADPDCKLGQILKALFKKDNFMTKVRQLFLLSLEWGFNVKKYGLQMSNNF